MTSTPEEREYFQAIEGRFIELRGAPLLLSPADWRLATGWYRDGIPLAVVLEALEDVFARRAERGRSGKIQGLRYCAAAVAEAWEDLRELGAAADAWRSDGTGSSRDVVGPAGREIGDRLEALAARVESIPGLANLATRIRALTGTVDEVEAELERMDGEALSMLEQEIEEGPLRAIEARLERVLEPSRTRLPKDELETLRRELRGRFLRRAAGLPRLTLFGG